MADALRREVLGGAYVDIGFPTESELCKRFNVSRFTVREALRSLTADGLIARKRGSGTVIQPATARGGALHQPLSNVAEILQYARNTRTTFELVGDAPLPRGIAQQLDLVAGWRWTKFKGLRIAAGSSEPIATTDAYVHESLRDYAAQIAPNEDTIFKQLERLAGIKIASVTQDIHAVAATNEVAAALGVPRRSPCLLILRCYRNAAGEILEISANHHPGDRFAYAMHIEVEG
ncbi:MAG: GntR family transcriptional regulator [Sphingopyxis sp.]|nr:GntR family transcriptional regulator [Sphingopyxis sp.]